MCEIQVFINKNKPIKLVYFWQVHMFRCLQLDDLQYSNSIWMFETNNAIRSPLIKTIPDYYAACAEYFDCKSYMVIDALHDAQNNCTVTIGGTVLKNFL